MKIHRLNASSPNRSVGSGLLSLALVALLLLPFVGFARPTVTGSPLKVDAHAVVVPLAPAGLLLEVNTTGDGDRVGGGTTCDSDAATPGEQCSLRAAIQTANATVGDDGIDIFIPASDPGCDAGTGRCTINLKKALPDLSSNMEFLGPGADKLTVRRISVADFRIFTVTTTGTAAFSGMTISDGSSVFSGGGIRNAEGTVNVTNCIITGNESNDIGGGIFNFSGIINVNNSTLSRNRTSGNISGDGGAIFTLSGTVNVTNSTISYNSSERGDGGGIANSGILNVTNSTITANFVGGLGSHGGGIANLRTLKVTNSTITSNLGGGVYNDRFSSASVKSSVIAMNAGGNLAPDVEGAFGSAGFNLIGKRDGSAGFIQPTDQTGTVILPLDQTGRSISKTSFRDPSSSRSSRRGNRHRLTLTHSSRTRERRRRRLSATTPSPLTVRAT